MELNKIKELISSTEELINNLQEELFKLKRMKLEVETGFKEGDLVIDKKGVKGILVYARGWGSCWHWNKLRKDGTPTSSVTYASCNITKIED